MAAAAAADASRFRTFKMAGPLGDKGCAVGPKPCTVCLQMRDQRLGELHKSSAVQQQQV